jgi:hypothetical protein
MGLGLLVDYGSEGNLILTAVFGFLGLSGATGAPASLCECCLRRGSSFEEGSVQFPFVREGVVDPPARAPVTLVFVGRVVVSSPQVQRRFPTGHLL